MSSRRLRALDPRVGDDERDIWSELSLILPFEICLQSRCSVSNSRNYSIHQRQVVGASATKQSNIKHVAIDNFGNNKRNDMTKCASMGSAWSAHIFTQTTRLTGALGLLNYARVCYKSLRAPQSAKLIAGVDTACIVHPVGCLTQQLNVPEVIWRCHDGVDSTWGNSP